MRKVFDEIADSILFLLCLACIFAMLVVGAATVICMFALVITAVVILLPLSIPLFVMWVSVEMKGGTQ